MVDMILLVQMRTMNKAVLKQAIQTTFELRGTHPIPTTLLEPPASWNLPFLTITKECRMNITLHDAFESVATYLSLTLKSEDNHTRETSHS